jgi:hypothetical protein
MTTVFGGKVVFERPVNHGAGHKSLILPRLRARDDLAVLDVDPFLDAVGVAARP